MCWIQRNFSFNENQLRDCYLWLPLESQSTGQKNYQFTISSLRKLEFFKKYPPGQMFCDRVSLQRIFFKTVAMDIVLQTIFFGREKGGSKELNHNTQICFLGGLEKSIKNVFPRW